MSERRAFGTGDFPHDASRWALGSIVTDARASWTGIGTAEGGPRLKNRFRVKLRFPKWSRYFPLFESVSHDEAMGEITLTLTPVPASGLASQYREHSPFLTADWEEGAVPDKSIGQHFQIVESPSSPGPGPPALCNLEEFQGHSIHDVPEEAAGAEERVPGPPPRAHRRPSSAETDRFQLRAGLGLPAATG
ncbi:hypothetical protein CB1_000849022 [Camelus ferus]|nr:hypothetical protein CB1_000849022 [Camelus ferus]